ncbi:hypothetical protein [Amphibacillus sediminis]|uniref:hypothetical protein n=1 Tax=Amphibacillus sediminis TaxID=360185 RepID=UPI0012EDD7B3|nr:hypothetical protein [Amphibacillus sediminis]
MSKWEIQQPVTARLVQLTFSKGERKLTSSRRRVTTSARAHPIRQTPIERGSLYQHLSDSVSTNVDIANDPTTVIR